MTEALKVSPTPIRPDSGVKEIEAITKGLADVLADTYRLTFKTHAYHWNVEGPLFYSVHNLTEGQYEDMFAAADELAERIRALGALAPWQLSWLGEQSQVGDARKAPTAGEMIAELADDHTQLAHRLHALVKLAGENNDPVTEDLATARSAFHEKAAWMLRALGAA